MEKIDLFLLNDLKSKAYTTVTWEPMDDLKHYATKNRFGNNLYTPESFSYTYNSEGFRCDDFTLDSNFPVVYMGCSFTSGVGLPLHETWAYKLHQKINLTTGITSPYWNLSTGGRGLDFLIAMLYKYLDQLKPKIIFMLCPSIYRRTYTVTKNHYITNWLPQDKSISTNLFLDKSYALYQTDKNLALLNLLLERYQTKCVLFKGLNEPFEQYLKFSNNILFLDEDLHMCDLARDSAHYGPVTHSNFVDQVWPKINHLFG